MYRDCLLYTSTSWLGNVNLKKWKWSYTDCKQSRFDFFKWTLSEYVRIGSVFIINKKLIVPIKKKALNASIAVSYTHLDVYKRQVYPHTH